VGTVTQSSTGPANLKLGDAIIATENHGGLDQAVSLHRRDPSVWDPVLLEITSLRLLRRALNQFPHEAVDVAYKDVARSV
jgi:hypothetical protein